MKIIVVGAVSLDHYVIVSSFPQEDSMVFAEKQFFSIGGSGANIATNIAVSGLDVDFYHGIGNDELGEKLLDKLNKNRVKAHPTKQAGPSAETLIIVDNEGRRRIISFGGNALYTGEPEYAIKAKLVCVVDSFPDIALKFFKHYEKSEKVYVPGGCGLYFGAKEIKRVAFKSDIIILSGPEAGAIGKEFYTISPIVIVTKGADSTEIYQEGVKTLIPVAPVKEKIIDTTGAGDAFASGFIFDFVRNKKLENAVKTGHYFAAKIITRFGANLGIL